jgi:large subunit ribosomal protein L10
MPLNRDEKVEAVAEIAEQIAGVNTIYLTDYAGLTVAQATKLRRAFRKAGIEFKVIKNTLLRRAMQDRGGYDELFDSLHGPTAVAMTNDPSSPAKVIKEFTRDQPLPRFKAAYVDGAVFIGEHQLDALASLKSKDELISDILGLLLSPAANVVGAIQSQGSNLLGAIKTIAEREG